MYSEVKFVIFVELCLWNSEYVSEISGLKCSAVILILKGFNFLSAKILIII